MYKVSVMLIAHSDLGINFNLTIVSTASDPKFRIHTALKSIASPEVKTFKTMKNV